MVILGIDPGSLKTGWGLIQIVGKKIEILESGVLIFSNGSQTTPFLERLLIIKNKMDQLMSAHNPDEIALESLIYVKSPTALIKLSQTRGVIISSFIETHHKKIFEYSPNLVKKTVSGYGHSDKEALQKFLSNIFGIKSYKSHDESDAIAIALCHYFNRSSNVINLRNEKTLFSQSSRSSSKMSLGKSVEHKISKIKRM
jgi:crossover junction endodeoxyribonuclease RuvC